MVSGWGYRVAGFAGTAVLTASVIALVNNTFVLELAGALPVLSGLPIEPPLGAELYFELLTATAAMLAAFVPLYKPRPRRILDTISLSMQRVLLAMIALAAIGYFDYTYRLPRLTVLLATPLLLVLLPGWFVWISRRPSRSARRAVIVGDDPDQIKQVVEAVNLPLFGYLSPTRVPAIEKASEKAQAVADGGRTIGRLGGLSRIEDVFVDYDLDTAFLAFENPDRAEFFGALDACYEHGVNVKVHREHTDSVLTTDNVVGTFVDVEIEPWDVQDYVLKRAFDVLFAGIVLLFTLPIILIIVIAIALEDNGPVFFTQERTYLFGETFSVRKFRTLKHDPDGLVGTTIDEERHTTLGRFLRTTHLDELPQLWSILRGDMSVVGPRPAQTEIEDDFEEEAIQWRRRWFVKPGLTGLAQINDATSQEPREKLQYDLQYIRNQSFWFDLKILIRQLFMVFIDAGSLLVNGDEGESSD